MFHTSSLSDTFHCEYEMLMAEYLVWKSAYIACQAGHTEWLHGVRNGAMWPSRGFPRGGAGALNTSRTSERMSAGFSAYVQGPVRRFITSR